MLFSDLRRGIDRCFYVPVLLSLPSSSWSPRKRGRVARRSSNSMAPPRIAPTMNRSLCSSLSRSARLSLDLHARTGRSVATSRSLASLHTPVRDDGRCSSKRVRRARGAVVGLETWEGIGTGEPIDGAIYRRKMRRWLLFCWTRRPNFQQIFRF